jgi:hypothetical protein
MILEPYLDIVPLGSDSCLSASDLFIAPVVHRGFQLLHDELLRRLADACAGRPVTQLEALAIVAQLPMERGRDRLEFQETPLTLDHNGGARFGQGIGPVVETVERVPRLPRGAQQSVPLLEEMAIPIQLSSVSSVDLRDQGVEEATPTLTRSFDERQIVGPEEHHSKRTEDVARSSMDTIQGEALEGTGVIAGRFPAAGVQAAAARDPDFELIAAAFGLNLAGDAGGRLSEPHQLARLLGAGRACQRRESYGFEQVRLSLGIAANEDAGRPLQAKLELRIVPKVEE